MNKTVVVSGRTRTGKNRVQNHGHVWSVLREQGNNVLLESVLDKYVCWIINPANGIVDMIIEGEFDATSNNFKRD